MNELVNKDIAKESNFFCGRFNPCTIAHVKQLQLMNDTKLPSFVFTTQTQNNKRNPLNFEQKLYYLNKIKEDYNFNYILILDDIRYKTFVIALQALTGLVNILNFYCGSDRESGYKEIIEKYNNKPDKTGKIPFSFEQVNFKILSRDEDTDISKMSATYMRQLVTDNNKDEFMKLCPLKNENDKIKMWDELSNILVH